MGGGGVKKPPPPPSPMYVLAQWASTKEECSGKKLTCEKKLYRCPTILQVIKLCENGFQNPSLFFLASQLSPEHSTLQWQSKTLIFRVKSMKHKLSWEHTWTFLWTFTWTFTQFWKLDHDIFRMFGASGHWIICIFTHSFHVSFVFRRFCFDSILWNSRDKNHRLAQDVYFRIVKRF